MNLFMLLILIVFLAVTAVLTFLNIDPTTVSLWPGYTYQAPKFGLMLIPFVFGGVLVFIAYVIRDTKRYIDGWKDLKMKRRETRIHDLYSKGANAVLGEKPDDARDFFRKILEERPDHLDTLMRLGDLAMKSGSLKEAADYYKKAREGEPRNLETLFSLARCLDAAGKQEEAMGIYDEILRIDEDSLAALMAKRSLYERIERWDEVNELERRVIKLQANPALRAAEQKYLIGFKYELGRYNLEGGNLEKAVRAFKTILRIDKNFVPGYLGLAEVFLREEKSDSAVELLENGYGATGSLTLLMRLEDLLLNLGDPNRIIGVYQKTLASDPGNAKLQFFLAKLYHRLEMLDDSFDILSKLDTGEVSYPDKHKLLGDIYMRRGNHELAAQEFRKALGMKRMMVIPYKCSSCGHTRQGWSGRCRGCGQWDTLTLEPAAEKRS
ncbi:MAG: tetratricopeptide repeat protein [Nitrospirae bacterium]|nr:tetratricopeptide repeat protein [Nitrospirota bacterium]